MNLNQLRVFTAVARASSITRAARDLKISQPAVSKQLAELEQTLGTDLVDRLPRGVRLTAAGQVLFEHAQRIFACERAAEADLAQMLGLQRGVLSVGASTTIGSYVIPALFGTYNRRHPHIRLELEIANTAAIQAAVVNDRLDVGLTEGFVVSDALEVQVVAHDDIVLIAAPGDPILAQVPVSAEALRGANLIMRERGSGSRDVIEAALGRLGVTVEPSMSLGSTEAVKNAVAAGLGQALVSRLTVNLELQAGRLVQVPMADLRIHRALHMLTLRGKRRSPAASAFVELLQELLQERPPKSTPVFEGPARGMMNVGTKEREQLPSAC